MKTRYLISTEILLCALLVASRAFALSTNPLTPEQVIARSEMVVVGTITEISTRWTVPTEAMIATDYKVRLDRIVHDPKHLFGVKNEGEIITLSFAGGQVGEKIVWVEDIPEFAVDETAIFLVDEENVGAISPLVGIDKGVYKISQGSPHSVVTDLHGVPVTKRFFSESVDKAAGFGLDEFVSELQRGLPIAASMPGLKADAKPEITDELRDLVFTGDQIPLTQPGPNFAAKGPATLPAEELYDREVPPSPDGHDKPIDAIGESVHDRSPLDFTFLWGPPNLNSTFNIPPTLYGGPNWGINFEYCESSWNRYATNVFVKYVTSDNNFAHQGRNDLAFTNAATFQTVYGFALGGTTIAIAVMYNFFGFSIGNGQQIYESDVICNVALTWTLDFQTAYNNANVWHFRAIVQHELGHCFGREHQFTGQPNSASHSVMNYPWYMGPPTGSKLHAEFWLPFVDDAGSIRSAYPARAAAISDLGIHFFRTNSQLFNGANEVLFAAIPATVQAGSSFNLPDIIIENLGTTNMTPQTQWYLTPTQFSWTNARYCNTTNNAQLAPFSQVNTSQNINVPANCPPGNYYVAAWLTASDGNNWNREAWSDRRIQVTAPPDNGLTAGRFVSHPGYGSELLRESCIGVPLADGATVKIFWDVEFDGPDDFDPQVVVGGGVGQANFNQFTVNGTAVNAMAGTYRSAVWVLRRPPNPYYFLRVYCANGGVLYTSEVETINTPDSAAYPQTNWVCENCAVCDGNFNILLVSPDEDQEGDQFVSECAHLCPHRPTRVCVPAADAGAVPSVSVVPGCFDESRCFDPTCDPANDVQYDENAWIFEIVDQHGFYCNTITLAPGAGEGCVCVSLDFLLDVEMGEINAIYRDGVVELHWNTRSESELANFEIARAVDDAVSNIIHLAPAANYSTGSEYSFTDEYVSPGHTYHYWVTAIGLDGHRGPAISANASTHLSDVSLPLEYALHQNFPNPFNPTTQIVFDMPEAGAANLTVHDLLGRQVAVLLNEQASAGRHSVTFDAQDLASGLYLCRMEAGLFRSEMKMLLMK